MRDVSSMAEENGKNLPSLDGHIKGFQFMEVAHRNSVMNKLIAVVFELRKSTLRMRSDMRGVQEHLVP